MSRELKFRMWDKVNNKFINPFRFEWNDYYKNTGMVVLDFHGKIRIADYSSGNGDNSANSVYLEVDNPDNYVVQQYTGLNDKNDNLIYEGDIVIDTQKQKYEIIFNENYARYDLKIYGENKLSQSSYFTSMYEKKHIEVIGNIFEHPELLK